jgi:hypothetical protein
MENRNETPEARFKRLATHRTNQVLDRLRVLGHCANRQNYVYSEEQVNKIFAAIEKRLKEVKAKFHYSKGQRFKL